MVNWKDYAPFTGLLIFGNIENLILASQGAVAHVNPYILGGLSLIAVIKSFEITTLLESDSNNFLYFVDNSNLLSIISVTDCILSSLAVQYSKPETRE